MAIKKYSINMSILIIFIVISLSGCFSHWQGDSAKVVISLGGASRGVYYNPADSETHQRLEHKIKFTNAAKTLEFSSNGGTTIEVYAEPGDWSVEIVSWLNGDVYAAGYKDVSLKLGLNNETINMYQAHLVKFVPGGGNAVQERIIFHAEKIENPPEDPTGDGWYDDSFTEPFDFTEKRIFESINFYAKWDTQIPLNLNTLAQKLEWIKDYAIDGVYYDVNVGQNESLKPQEGDLSFGGKTVIINLKLADSTSQSGTISLSEEGILFSVGAGVTLKLNSHITLQGLPKNNSYLINVSENGKLIMNDGSMITENTNAGWLAGVYVNKNAAFVMNGGEISNITASVIGAVDVEGTFTMNGGKICNNKVTDNSGGGVWAMNGGTFYMNGGEISGNSANVWDGGGVQVYNGGTFYMSGGTISGNEAKNGGGGVNVWIQGDDPYNPPANSTFIMTGGTISGNKSQDDGGGGVKVGKYETNFNSTFTMTGGIIYDNTASKSAAGGGVYVYEGATFYMKGGDINKNNGLSGGGVQAEGTFEMEGGNISGNTAKNGGGVEVGYNGNFKLKGGNIHHNTADYNAGVSTDGNFKMEGGNIYGNTAINGGGGGVGISWNGSFIMTGGEIYGNTAFWMGGGVYLGGPVGKPTFTKTGGIIYGNNGDVKSNIALGYEDIGHAVVIMEESNDLENFNILAFRNATAGPDVILDSSKAGGWENNK